MSFFFLIYQLFVPHFAMAVLCVYRINKHRDTSFEFSSIISGLFSVSEIKFVLDTDLFDV